MSVISFGGLLARWAAEMAVRVGCASAGGGAFQYRWVQKQPRGVSRRNPPVWSETMDGLQLTPTLTRASTVKHRDDAVLNPDLT